MPYVFSHSIKSGYTPSVNDVEKGIVLPALYSSEVIQDLHKGPWRGAPVFFFEFRNNRQFTLLFSSVC